MAQPILVVDDSNALRIALWTTLSEAGYSMEMSANGAAALEVLRHSPHRLVVLLEVSAADTQRDSQGSSVVEQVAAETALASRHAYIALSAGPDLLPSGVLTLLMRLRAPILATPVAVDILLLLVAEASERLMKDSVAL